LVGGEDAPDNMPRKPAFVLLIPLVLLALNASGQQPNAATVPAVPPEIEQWMRAAWGVDPKALGYTDTHFLLSLSESERQGAFLFKQRCSLCHYSMVASVGGARSGFLTSLSVGPALSKKSVDGQEDGVRKRIMEGSARMPAFKYALKPPQVDMIIGYLKKVDSLRPPGLDETVDKTRKAIPNVTVAVQ
jgi:mono/diheme cytochrome c family protein